MAARPAPPRPAWYRRRLSVAAPTAPTIDPAADRAAALARLAELTARLRADNARMAERRQACACADLGKLVGIGLRITGFPADFRIFVANAAKTAWFLGKNPCQIKTFRASCQIAIFKLRCCCLARYLQPLQ